VRLTFGARSGVYAQRLTGIDTAIIADPEALASAYLAAVRGRETGHPFYGMFLYEDRRSRIIMLNAGKVIASTADPDLQRALVEKFCNGDLKIDGGITAGTTWAGLETALEQPLSEFFALCDGMLVRSNTEFLRLVPLLRRPRRVEPVVVEPLIPTFERERALRPAVVVWAPERPSVQVSLHAVALSEFHGEVTYVTSDGAALEGYRGSFVRNGPGLSEIFARACCVLCVDPDDPGAAVAFARRGLGVVAPLTSGAHEFVRDVVTFDIGTFASIFNAVQIAIAQPASVRALPVPPPVPSRPALPPLAELPLVTVVLCTYNRRDDVGRALSCLQQQTYPKLEVVVVNDAGENVDDVIARFPRARPHNLPVNGGVLRAIGEGLRQARGEYIQVLADDDWLQPDHVEGLVGAMLRTGAAFAHGNTLIRYQDVVRGGEPLTTGFNAVTFNESTTPSGAMITTAIAGNSLMFRRDVLEAIGSWREDCILADQEFQLRVAQHYVMVYVDRMTAEWRARGKDNLSTNTDSSIELKRMYEELHPLPESRRHLQLQRDATLANVAGREQGVFVFPPTIKVNAVSKEPVRS
jgi:GT2 family glycosyltransferase